MVNASSVDAAIEAQSSRMAVVALKNEHCEFERKTEVEELKKTRQLLDRTPCTRSICGGRRK
jgi:hypothetical protein